MNLQNTCKGKRVLVCGAGGFMGMNMVKQIKNTQASKIIASYRTERAFYDNVLSDVERVSGDLTDKETCLNHTKDVDYLIICNAISFGLTYTKKYPLALLNVNTIANINLLEAAQQNGVEKVIYFGSSVEYHPTLSPIEEKDVLVGHPADVYFGAGWMKRYMEILMRMYSEKLNLMSCGIVRLANAYGPYDKFIPQNSHVLPALIKKFSERENPLNIYGDGNQLKDLIYINDVTKITLKMLDTLKGFDSMNVGSGKFTSINHAIEILSKQENFYPEIIHLEEGGLPPPIRNLNVDKMKSFYNHPLTTIEEGIWLTTEWYKSHKTNIYR